MTSVVRIIQETVGDTPDERKIGVLLDEMKDKDAESASCSVFGLDVDPGFHPKIEDFFPRTGKKNKEGKETMKPLKVLQTVTTYYGREFHVKPLYWEMFCPDFTIAVFGKRRSGKTFWIQSLCSFLRPYFPEVVCFTRTKCSGEWLKIIPEKCIIEGLNDAVLESLYDRQRTYKTKQSQGKKTGNINLLVIMDDCLSSGLRNNKLINEVFYEGRHLNICFIVTSQDVKGIHPAATSNSDVAVCFNVRSERDKEALRTKYADVFKNNDDFGDLLEKVTALQYHCVAFLQAYPHLPVEETVFMGRAEKPEPFVMGSRKLWYGAERQLIDLGFYHLLNKPDWGIYE